MRHPKPDLSDIPMLTTDGFQVRNNQLLYKSTFDRYNRNGKSSIDVYRVIKIFPKERYFVYRCVKGCESHFYYNLAGACSKDQMFAKPSNVRKELKSKILTRIESLEREIQSNKSEIKKLRLDTKVKIGSIPK